MWDNEENKRFLKTLKESELDNVGKTQNQTTSKADQNCLSICGCKKRYDTSIWKIKILSSIQKNLNANLKLEEVLLTDYKVKMVMEFKSILPRHKI